MTALLLAVWSTTCEMAPYLLFGFFVAGALSVLLPPDFVARHLGRPGIWTVCLAALLGIPLPLCSCGVIPVGASLRRHGASRGATTAFLMSTPQTGVDSLLVTYSLLGPIFAIFRPLAALFSGMVGGILVNVFDDDGSDDAPPACQDDCCTNADDTKLVRALRYGFSSLPRDIGPSLAIGLLVAGLIGYLIPADFFAHHLASPRVAMVAMLVLGVPLYVCATASVPIAAALIAKGVSPGAALVFLMTGPATNAAAITTIWKVLGRRTACLFLLAVIVSALVAGLALDMSIANLGTTVAPPAHTFLPSWLKQLSAVILLVVIGQSLRNEPPTKQIDSPDPASTTLTFEVRGMTCSHCESHVVNELQRVPGVDQVVASAATASVQVTGSDLDQTDLIAAIESAGYAVNETKND